MSSLDNKEVGVSNQLTSPVGSMEPNFEVVPEKSKVQVI